MLRGCSPLLVLLTFALFGCGKEQDLRVYDADKTTRPVLFNTPDGWYRAQPNRRFNERYAWQVIDGAQPLRVTISDFPTDKLDLLENYNRWRKQIGLDPVTAAEMKQHVRQRDIDGIPVHIVDISSAESAPRREVILGAIFIAKKRTWFLKLHGPVDAARNQQATFDAWIPRAVAAINHAVREPAEEEPAHGA